MADYRVPRGFARRHPAYQELMEGERPTLKGLRAATYLPVAEIESRHDDPIVIPAGTWVGLWTPTGSTFTTGNVSSGGLGALIQNYSINNASGYIAMVPAASGPYKLVYSSNDISTDFGTNGYVMDLDGIYLGTVVSAAKTTTAVVGDPAILSGGGVKPIGITYTDIYAGWLGSVYSNYDRQPNIGFLASNKIIQVPCLTTGEMKIEPGDICIVDGFDQVTTAAATNAIWSPTVTPSDVNCAGRLRALKDFTPGAGAAFGSNDMVVFKRLCEMAVGRCLRKIPIAYRPGTTKGTKLSAAISAGTINSISQINSEFRHAGRVQTVPGLGLQGSGTFGLGGHLLAARADSAGVFWALEIMVNTY